MAPTTAKSEPDTTPKPDAPSTSTKLDTEIERLKAHTALKNAQQALREGEDAQQQLQRSYDNSCLGARTPLELIRPCADMRFALDYTGPKAISKLKDDIRGLARLLGLDPEEAARSFAR